MYGAVPEIQDYASYHARSCSDNEPHHVGEKQKHTKDEGYLSLLLSTTATPKQRDTEEAVNEYLRENVQPELIENMRSFECCVMQCLLLGGRNLGDGVEQRA